MKFQAHHRFPAEWEKQGAVLLAWPHGKTSWGPIAKLVEPVFKKIAAAISKRANLIIAVHDFRHVWKQLRKSGADTGRVILAKIEIDDTWIRDYGPITIIKSGSPVLLKFAFNGWGRKYPADKDNLAVSRFHSAGIFGRTAIWKIPLILEGGSIDSDGAGTILTTSACLLNPNRNPSLSRISIENRLKKTFGAKRILWLEHGQLEGDDTDGHVDTLARFAPGNAIVYVACDDERDPHFMELKKMEAELKAMRTLSGRPYKMFPLPWPSAKFDSDGNRLPATYANFLILNKAVLVPMYRDRNDGRAINAIRKAFPGYQVEGIDCLPLILQHGSLHCTTMQIPAIVFQ
ncbi:MAG: agmatine deiminase family protein [Kiritimatiellae bacterium]|nr:agmatine deiminase family protein [Kiritimatiellia bacterium]MDD5521853.1 agmatine deiminase family protein [Kiritimatiellia bacterium]